MQTLEKASPSVSRETSANSEFTVRPVAFGLLVRKQRWGLSWRGWLMVTLGGTLAFGFVLKNVYPFLAVTERVDAKVLVVEGWVHQSAIEASVREFKAGHYERVFTTGGPIVGTGAYTSDFNTAASVGADRLKEAGLATELIQMVPCRENERDRTFSSAVALRDWLRLRNVRVDTFNVLTEDTHARRTRFLFEKAFHGSAKVGVISIPSPDYDASHWWRYSQGVEDLYEQGVSYIYARLFFHGGAPR